MTKPSLQDLMKALPQEGAEHECSATGRPERRCFVGGWTVHGPHDYATWSGELHCPGRTADRLVA